VKKSTRPDAIGPLSKVSSHSFITLLDMYGYILSLIPPLILIALCWLVEVRA